MKRLTAGTGAAVIFAVVFLALMILHGNRLVFSSDEGIILDAAARMVHGQVPYRDFFGYMSPGSYWLQEAAFRIFGLNLWAGRVIVIFDFALQCALLFWLTARLAGRKAALAATFLFFAIQTAKPDFLLAQHRMDSTALSVLSIALCLEARRSGKARQWLAAGALVAVAAMCTPSTAPLALVTVIWLLAERCGRRTLLLYIGGGCIAGLTFVTMLAVNRSLVPLMNQMHWLWRNYSEVNAMPYGSIIGGYRAALGSAGGIDGAIRALALFCLALPAVLPVLALAGWGASLLGRRTERRWAIENAIPYLLACTVVYIASAYPRADVAHLAFVAVLPTSLSAAWVARFAPRWIAPPVFGVLVVGAGLLLSQAVAGLRGEVAVSTPVGTLRAAPPVAEAVAALCSRMHAAETVFVHPYMPMLYFLTQGTNPTAYSYLAPGMMTRVEESQALQALTDSPPRWVLYLPLSREEYLRVYPHATRLEHYFPLIEDWRAREYTPVEPPLIVGGYQLYQRRSPPASFGSPPRMSR